MVEESFSQQQSSLHSQIGKPWIQALLYFKFDLEIGAVLDTSYPVGCLSPQEERELCTLAFPEVQTNYEVGSTLKLQSQLKDSSTYTSQETEVMNYTFRLRQKAKDFKPATSMSHQDQSLKYMSANTFNFNYCYTLFRKKRDQQSKRGWTQESFVLVSELNLVCLFYRLSELISRQELADDISSVFQSLYEQSVKSWPWPNPASTVRIVVALKGLEPVSLDVQLPESMLRGLNATQITAREQIFQSRSIQSLETQQQVPANQQELNEQKPTKEEQKDDLLAVQSQHSIKQQLMKQFFDNTIRGIGDELKIEEAFPGNTLLLLWNLWELLITEQPLLVVGGDPRECSHAILTALSLVHPLTSFADVRPYLTIQNCDTEVYHEMLKQGVEPKAVIGISSPLLTKNFSTFPAILRLDNNFFKDLKIQNPKTCLLTQQSSSNLKKVFKETKQTLLIKAKKSLTLKPQQFVIDHFDFTSNDRITVNDFNIRSHFKHLTKTFLDSFELYWKCDVSQPTLLRPFSEKEFIKLIDKNNRFCRQFMQGKVEKTRQLYKSFVQTSIFRQYNQTKREEVIQKFLT